MSTTKTSHTAYPAVKASANLTDDALVTFGEPVAGGVSFHDEGYMPVVSVGGMTVPHGMSLFIKYAADGIQHFSATGVPTTADYTKLHYELDAAPGTAKFGHAESGTPTVSGILNSVKVTEGDLISGRLGFTPTGGVAGNIQATSNIHDVHVGKLGISIQHAAGDMGYTATGGLMLSGGNLQADFVPSIFG